MLRSIDFKTMPYLFTDKAGTCLTVEFDGRELDDIDLDNRISEYAKWIESRYDDLHELRVKGQNGYIDGKADAYESSLREFKRIFNMKEE